jgi:hypothetical protein
MPKKRPFPGICVHCLKWFDLLTWDHVLPESWYPEGTDELEKWQIPACERCNQELGKIEENLLIKLGLCLDPKDLASLGIPDKVLRSLNPEVAKNDRDRTYRKAKRVKILKGIKISKSLPQQGIFPNFGPLKDIEYKEYSSVSLGEEEIKKFAEKITKGIAYIADKSYIDGSYKIELFVIDEQKATELRKLVDSKCMLFDLRPGMLVKRVLLENDKVAGIYFIEIWGRFRMYVLVIPKNLDKNPFNP